MFLPHLKTALACATIGAGLLLSSGTSALAQMVPEAGMQSHAFHRVFHRVFHRHGLRSTTHTDAILAALSAEAGVPFFTTAEAARRTRIAAAPAARTETEPALCVRAGVGISPAVMSGSEMTVEHGLIGCRTETAGLPITVSRDPAMQPPPASRTGEYNLDLSLRYRVLRLQHMQVEASVTEQGVAYSIDSPVSGNNVLAAMSVLF